MINIIDKSRCTGCTACMNACPVKCITMKLDQEGFNYPEIERNKCINCNLCETVCPMHKVITKKTPDLYLLKNKNDYIREISTSGGVFYELAKYVVLNNGVVYGAYYDDEEKKLSHIKISTEKDVKKLLKSKYMQSDLKGIFKEIENLLKEKIIVLFCGTPCQVAGLSSYLKKNYNNLLLVDFVCHGVPSQYVWKKYIESIENKNNIVKKIHFRYKKENWTKCAIKIDLTNKTIIENLSENSFLLNYNDSLFLRPSCYDCAFKGDNRFSDLTLSDAWGVNIYDNKFYDEKGISCVLVNSEMGELLLNKVINLFYEKRTINLDEFIKYNSQYIKSAVPNKNRDSFFDDLRLKGYDYSIKKHGKKKKSKCIFTLKCIIKKIIKR